MASREKTPFFICLSEAPPNLGFSQSASRVVSRGKTRFLFACLLRSNTAQRCINKYLNKRKNRRFAFVAIFERKQRARNRLCVNFENADYQRFPDYCNWLGTNLHKLGTNFNKLGTNSDNRGVIFDDSSIRDSNSGKQMQETGLSFNVFLLIKGLLFNICSEGIGPVMYVVIRLFDMVSLSQLQHL